MTDKSKPVTNRAMRFLRGAEYGFFFIAAVVTLIAPSNIIFGILGEIPFFVYFWSVLFMVGAGACLYGVFKKKWVGEYIGLPGIITCLFLYAIGCFVDTQGLTIQRIFLGFIFFGFVSLALSRRQDVKLQKRLSEFEQRKSQGLPGL